MIDAILRVAYFVGLVVGTSIRVVHRRRNRVNRTALERETGLDLLFVSLPSLGMILLPLAYVLTPWLAFADYRLTTSVRAAAGVVGAVTYGAGLWLLWRSHADLGRNWSPTLEIREGHSLVTGGVYRHIRHPMYAAHWLWGLGQALLLQNWVVGLATLVTLAPLYFYRVPREEQMMVEQFGDEYRAYAARTGRVLPRLAT